MWLAEHHFTTYSVCPSVHMMGVLAAARTKRLRIGTAVSLAALYHPLRLAEEVALLDVLSGGRVNWGAGRGFEPAEFDAFGVPIDESAAASARPSRSCSQAWSQERLTLPRQAFGFRRRRGAAQADAAADCRRGWRRRRSSPIDWAAGRGFSILMDPHASTRELGAKRQRYAEKMAASGFSDKAATFRWPA